MCAKAPPGTRHHPLWTALHEEITPARLTALTSTPLFTERYNDWWDSEKRPVGRPVLDGRTPAYLHQGGPGAALSS